MPLKGNLNDFGLEEVIQTLFTSKRSGKLEISGKMGNYGIFFENGKIIHAFGPFVIGEEAIKDAFLEDQGSFVFKQNLVLPPQTIEKDNFELIMEDLEIREELLNIAKNFKRDSKVPTSDNKNDNIEISGEEWHILRCLMEDKPIIEIIEKGNLSFAEFNKTIKNLCSKGLVKVGG